MSQTAGLILLLATKAFRIALVAVSALNIDNDFYFNYEYCQNREHTDFYVKYNLILSHTPMNL